MENWSCHPIISRKNGLIITMLKSKGLLYFLKLNYFTSSKQIVQVNSYGHFTRAILSIGFFGFRARDYELCKGLLSCLIIGDKHNKNPKIVAETFILTS